jgi:hypothetical protein
MPCLIPVPAATAAAVLLHPIPCCCYIPSSGWGDYCVLTADHANFGGAADGPLEEGNLGVVVGVDHRPDGDGGLKHSRYVVRASHNGLLHRYASAPTFLNNI